MRNLFLPIVFWPLMCFEQCDFTYACLAIAIVAAVVLYIIASIVYAMQALSSHRPQSVNLCHCLSILNARRI